MGFIKRVGIEPEKVDESQARITVRGIAFRDGKVLMLASNRGEFTFPGGGIEENETEIEALKREVLEETGYTCQGVGECLGKVFFRKPDKYDLSQMYELVSHYYLVEVSEKRGFQNLTPTEAGLEIKPMWVSIEEAIHKNKSFRQSLEEEDYWILQELYVLDVISEIS